MRHSNALIPLASLLSTALAWAPPGYAGFNTIWYDAFSGAGGSAPNGNNWNIVTGNLGVNNELQTCSRNLQLSGGDTLQLVPWRDGGAPNGWTSGRIESKYVFAPREGGLTRVEAQVRFGGNGAKQGLWPAFWLLGQALREGRGWPACGELDVMETVNGQLVGHGTIHCDVYPGGACSEPTGVGAAVGFGPDQQGWHTWRLEWDLRSGDWAAQTLQWSVDGRVFHTVAGARIGNQAVWNTLAHSPMYFLLNMAVGGDWPGYPNSGTQDGYGSMMEVAYVAHYQN